jgi:preprotein translocase subunit SecE
MRMNAQTEIVQNSGADVAKWIAALAVLGGGVYGFYYLGDANVLLRVGALLVAVGVAVALAYTTYWGRFAWVFMQESRVELRKVIWPAKQETINATLLVFVIVAIAGVLLWGIDGLFQYGVHWLLGRGS